MNETNANEAQQVEKIWKALAKYGIHTEAELKEAVKKMKPLNIGCMVSVRNGSEAAV
ncbi:hypothetical protein [Sporosarcina sp. FSL K6-1508]|uniref:hypothetical protein n=1 Tax=Sporosarcina sp. FSL K6-1508 TaxID=2921553 RepID=UPI0030FAB86B